MRRDFREMVKELKERGSNITKINGVSVDQLEGEQGKKGLAIRLATLWSIGILAVGALVFVHPASSCGPADAPVATMGGGANIDEGDG